MHISAPALPFPKRPERAGKMRWKIVWVLFFSTVTNYISRQSFSVLSPMITSQYHLTHSELARILGAFQIAYAVTWLIGGVILDAVGCRMGLALAAIWCTERPWPLILIRACTNPSTGGGPVSLWTSWPSCRSVIFSSTFAAATSLLPSRVR